MYEVQAEMPRDAQGGAGVPTVHVISDSLGDTAAGAAAEGAGLTAGRAATGSPEAVTAGTAGVAEVAGGAVTSDVTVVLGL